MTQNSKAQACALLSVRMWRFDSIPRLVLSFRLTSANSINIGRLLPPTVYFANAAIQHYRRHRAPCSVIVPNGNLGNGLAAILARAKGLPISAIILARNSNRAIVDYFRNGTYRPHLTVKTVASAMDAGDPSNLERLRKLSEQFTGLCDRVEAYAVDDESICRRNREGYQRYQRIDCPHTAVAICVYDQLRKERRSNAHWITTATAHAEKFANIVEPLVGRVVPAPRCLFDLINKPSRCIQIDPDVNQLAEAIATAN